MQPALAHPAIAEDEGSEAAGRGWTVSAGYMLALLTLVNAFNYLDRNLLGLVLPLIKADMHISDTTLGLISGLAFAFFYSTMGVPIARLADRFNRRNIIAVGLAVWSLATVATGMVTNVWQLVVTRFFLGAGEASSIAPSNSIVCDLFGKMSRPMAVAVLGTAASISSIALVPIAAWISQEYGWRMAFIAAGVPGLVLVLLLLGTSREPARRAVRADERLAFWPSVRSLMKSRAFLMILLAESFLAVNLNATSVWVSSFLVRVHGFGMLEVGGVVGPLRGFTGLAGTLIGGLLVARLTLRDERWRMWVPALASSLVFPGQLLFLLSGDITAALSGYGFLIMMTMVQQPAVFAVALAIAPPRMRATAIAILMLFANLTGQLIGPLAVGILNDTLSPMLGDEAIRYSLALCSAFPLAAGFFLWLGSRDEALPSDADEPAQAR